MHPLSILSINTRAHTHMHTHIEAQIAMKCLTCGTKKKWKELLIQDFEEMPNKQTLFCYKTSVTISPKRKTA